MKKVTNILFDLDNTLVRCMVYYEFIRKNMFRKFSELSGLEYEEISKIFTNFERNRIKRPDGFDRNAFLDSINETRIEILNRITDEEKRKNYIESDEPFKMINFGDQVYNAPYTKYDDVDIVLSQLKDMGINLYIVTKGSFYIQSQKVMELPKVFSGLFVIPHKNKSIWKGIAEAIEADFNTTYVVGDSVKDDILPALEAGLKAVHISRGNTSWVGDPTMNVPVGVDSIVELKQLLDVLFKETSFEYHEQLSLIPMLTVKANGEVE